MHGHIELMPFRAARAESDVRCGNGHVGSYHRIRADIDMRVVNGGEVEVCVYRVAEMDVRPPQFAWNGGSR